MLIPWLSAAAPPMERSYVAHKSLCSGNTTRNGDVADDMGHIDPVRNGDAVENTGYYDYIDRRECENHVRELRTFFTVVLEPNIHTFSVLSETLPDFLKSKLC